ncbi:hypothetical protein S83_052437, partial [Arachis hypogaea]
LICTASLSILKSWISVTTPSQVLFSIIIGEFIILEDVKSRSQPTQWDNSKEFWILEKPSEKTMTTLGEQVCEFMEGWEPGLPPDHSLYSPPFFIYMLQL